MFNEINRVDPFMEKVNRSNEFGKKEDEVIGKGNNRKLDEKWNIKVTVGADFFDEIFRFLRELGYDTIFRFNKEGMKIYILDASTSHASYVLVDKTEMAEYKNLDGLGLDGKELKELDGKEELVIYVDMDVIEDMLLNNRYPVDMYFDTIEKKRMYIVNGKEIVRRRLNSLDNKDNTNSTYEMYLDKIFGWIKNENTFKVGVGYNGFKGVIGSLEKKKGKQKETKMVDIKFGKDDIDFIVGGGEDEVKSSSIMMYGEDILVRGLRDVQVRLNLEYVVKLGKLKFNNNISFYINENLPLVVESKFGTGKIIVYYVIAPKKEQD